MHVCVGILMEQPMKVVDDKTAMSKITLVNGSAAESDFILSAKTLDATNPATISNELEYAVSEFYKLSIPESYVL